MEEKTFRQPLFYLHDIGLKFTAQPYDGSRVLQVCKTNSEIYFSLNSIKEHEKLGISKVLPVRNLQDSTTGMNSPSLVPKVCHNSTWLLHMGHS